MSLAGIFGILAGVISSMLESVGDYYACARLCGAPSPPRHAISRGIGVEGIGCLLAGAWGTGSGTTSYSENVGALGITKVSLAAAARSAPGACGRALRIGSWAGIPARLRKARWKTVPGHTGHLLSSPTNDLTLGHFTEVDDASFALLLARREN